MATMLNHVVGSPATNRALASPRGADQTALPAADVRIDGWLVQPMLNKLTRDEVRVRLRPQLMDLLLCLASHPGRVFTRNELVAEVWESRWIAESALSRCVAELRAALGDNAHRPHVIETITKRGYRLIAPVEPVTVPETASFAPARTTRLQAVPAVAACARNVAPLSPWQRFKLASRPASGTPGAA